MRASAAILRSDRLLTLFLFLMVLLLWGITCGLWDLRGADEGRYALVGKELLGRSNWLPLTLQGEPYDQKPPLPFWIFAGMTALNGGEISAWILRLPSILFAAITLICTFWIGRVRLGRSAGLVAAITLMTSAQFIDDAPTVELNMMFTGWITMSLAAWLTRPDLERMSLSRTVFMWVALACAFFTKGPLAIIIVLIAVITEAIGHRSWKVFRASSPFIGLPLLLAAIGGWLWAQKLAAGGEFVTGQIQGQTVDRFLHGSHEEPFYYYIPRIFTSIFAPWGVFLIPASILLWKQRKFRPLALDPILGLVGVTFLILCIANGKRQSYLMPLMPGMALIVGWFITRPGWREAMHPRIALALRGILLMMAVILICGGTMILLRLDLAWDMKFYAMKWQLGVSVLLGAACILLTQYTKSLLPSRSRVFIELAAVMLIIAAVNFVLLKPAHNPDSTTRIFANQLDGLLHELGKEKLVYAVNKAEKPEYHVYGNYKVHPLNDRDFESDPGSVGDHVLLIRRDEWAELREMVESAGFLPVQTMTVTEDALIVASRSPKPSRDAGSSLVRLAVTGDTGTGKEAVRALANLIATKHDITPFDATLLLGDNIYGDDSFRDSVFELFEQPFASLLERGVPFYAALGNHDDREEVLEDELNYDDFHMSGRRYYEETFGEDVVSVFVLDSNTLKHDPVQLAWFRAELESCTSSWKILALHHPMQASDLAHGPDPELYRLLKPIITGSKDVDLVLTGHNHIYERREVVDGILHMTIGNGGQYEKEELPEDSSRKSGFTGHLAFADIEIHDDILRIQVIDESGNVADKFEVTDTESPPMVHVLNIARTE